MTASVPSQNESPAIFEAAKRHTMERIAGAALRESPFPHIYVENVFPDAFYAEIRKHLLPIENYTPLVQSGRVAPTYSAARYSLFPEALNRPGFEPVARDFWKSLFTAYCDAGFIKLWLNVFGAQIRARAQSGGIPGFQEKPGVRSEIFLMRDLVNYALRPHTDSPQKLVSALFYLPGDSAHPELGTSMNVPKTPGLSHDGGPVLERHLFELAGTAPYVPNTLLALT